MQSKTSCFNKTLFKKHVTRFWPVWAAYLAVWLLDMPVAMLSQRDAMLRDPANYYVQFLQQNVLNGIGAGVIVSFIFSVLMAMAVWSFLYSARSASGAACLPVTRTAQYFSAMLAGLLPLVAVHVVTFLLMVLAEASIGMLHLPTLLAWLGASLLNLLFFYGFATLCAMLTGNIIVLPAVYLVLNFVAAGLLVLLNGLAGYFLYGLTGLNGDWMLWLSPVVKMMSTLSPTPITAYDAAKDAYLTVGWRFEGWWISAIYAVVGVLLLVAARALLRRRKMESAGDVVAVPALKPVFRWCMGLGAGICFADMMLYLFNLSGRTQRMIFLSTAIWLVIGAFLGWFIAEMLIRRSFKVFRGGWRGFGGWALCCVVLIAALAATELDLFGVERYVPRADKIESVVVHCQGENAYLTTSEGIADAMELHREIISHKAQQDQCAHRVFFDVDDSADYQTAGVNINYLLANGGSVTRYYSLPHRYDETGDDASAVQALLNCPEAVQHRKETPFEFTPENVSYGSLSAVMPARDCAAAAGYDDPETYVLCELAGYTRAQVGVMPEEDRAAKLRETLTDWRYVGDQLYYDSGYYEKYYYDVYDSYTDVPPLPEKDGGIDWDRIWLNYTLELTRQEAWELYESCVAPDIANNALGRVWVLNGSDYAAAVYSAGVEINARWPEEDRDAMYLGEQAIFEAAAMPMATTESGVRYYSFTTTPTVASARTNAFFEAHGLNLHTVGEIRAAAG